MSKLLTFVIIFEHALFQILAIFLDASIKFNTCFFVMKTQLEKFLLQDAKEAGL